jgi:hypothetical protein
MGSGTWNEDGVRGWGPGPGMRTGSGVGMRMESGDGVRDLGMGMGRGLRVGPGWGRIFWGWAVSKLCSGVRMGQEEDVGA